MYKHRLESNLSMYRQMVFKIDFEYLSLLKYFMYD